MKSCPTCNRTYPDDTLAFCLVDGAVLSAPYDPEQTRRIPAPRPTVPAATQVLGDKESASPQSTIRAPAPAVPPLAPRDVHAQFDISERRKLNLLPWLLITVAIMIVGIFGVWMIVSRLPATVSSPRSASPEPTSTVAPKTEAICGHIVSPAIFKKWNETGGENGKLGCPINQLTDAPTSPLGSVGQWIQFAKGDGGYLIEWTPAQRNGQPINAPPDQLPRQVFEVSGCMFKLYADLGGTKSWLGMPTGDGYEIPEGAQQNFEGGYIDWDRKTYVCNAHQR